VHAKRKLQDRSQRRKRGRRAVHKMTAHHEALEFPDGQVVLLTALDEGQQATVLQLPARPASAAEADAQKRVTYVG